MSLWKKSNVKITDKRCSYKYPELWVRCDVRNKGNDKMNFQNL